MQRIGVYLMTGQTFTRHDLEARIVRRSWEDEEFRKEFNADPAGAFSKYLQVPAADLPRITVHQEEPGTWHIVLPSKPANAAALSEEDLEKVAGGITTPAVISITIAGAITLVGAPAISASAAVSLDAGW
jgi:hypothetical protein